MISALEVWALAGQGGAASLYKTLEAYGRRGHQVDFVSATVGANHPFGALPQPPPAIEGVAYHLFHLPSLLDARLLGKDAGRGEIAPEEPGHDRAAEYQQQGCKEEQDRRALIEQPEEDGLVRRGLPRADNRRNADDDRQAAGE